MRRSWQVIQASGLLLATSLLAQEKTETPANSESYWEDLTDGSIDLFEDKNNALIQRVRLTGRLHIQAALVDGNDARQRQFEESFDEYRRARIEVEFDLLHHASIEIGLDLVEDDRFRRGASGTHFGYQQLSDAFLAIDLDGALKLDVVDDLDLRIGRQKVGIGFERDQSSNSILTVERSALADRLGSEISRPTGALLEVEQKDFSLSFGYFSTSPSLELASIEGDGFYYTRFEHKPSKKWTWFVDWVRAETNGPGLGTTGYAWANSLNVVHERKRVGFALTVAQGKNGGPEFGHDRPRRQGAFYGGMISPWFWIKPDYLQFVLQGQWQQSKQTEGIRIASRYLRQIDDFPSLNVENGYGDSHQALYAGLNYHPWGGSSRFMFGISHDHLETVRLPVEAVTQWAAFRAVF